MIYDEELRLPRYAKPTGAPVHQSNSSSNNNLSSEDYDVSPYSVFTQSPLASLDPKNHRLIFLPKPLLRVVLLSYLNHSRPETPVSNESCEYERRLSRMFSFLDHFDVSTNFRKIAEDVALYWLCTSSNSTDQ
ncbi:hypothetical protein RCL1_002150 [Eukaryota sp. TZLM3-RCL]